MKNVNMLSERIQSKIVSSDKTIIQTMKLMDEAFTKLFLVFEGERFLGIITNGDLQRAIIANTPFDTPIGKIVSREGKLYAHVGDNREEIKDWMLSKRAELMPVLDENEQLVDVIFWDYAYVTFRTAKGYGNVLVRVDELSLVR